MMNMGIHKGGCHCGRVRYEVEAPKDLEVAECNCSICTKAGYVHLVVPKSRFRLVTGQEFLTTYQFNTGVAEHPFCSVCGVRSFYVPRAYPEGISVNVRCLDTDTVESTRLVRQFNGHEWEASVSTLPPLPE